MKTLMTIALAALLVLSAASSTVLALDDAELVALVEKAQAAFKEKGTPYALKLIGSLDGPFRKREVFAFALSFDGVMLAHPVNKGLEGKNVLEMKDKKGNYFFKKIIEEAKGPGIGWVEYYWQRHGEPEPTLTRTFILKVPGEDIVVAAGLYEK
jgi:signal transduction histidine kinase